MAATVKAFLLVFGCLLLFQQARGSNFRHIGCYHVVQGNEGLRYNYGTLRLDQCAAGCNREGYPFIALREGRDCLCVMEYGQGGAASFSAMCNYTCAPDGTMFLCGGVSYDDVYYSVDTDSKTALPLRDTLLHNDSATFDNARMTCVRENGDLPIIVNEQHLFSVWDLARYANATAVWVGAYRTTWGHRTFQWAGLRFNGANNLLDLSENSTMWSASNTFSGSCVTLLTSKMKLEAVDCEDSYPYVCHQVPPPETTGPPVVEGTTPAPTTEEYEFGAWASADMKLALFIVLPIFFVMFFGSCFCYCCHRLWRYCRRSRYRKQRLNSLRKAQLEFESDTKPLASSDMTPRPLTARDVTVQRKSPWSGKGSTSKQPPINEVHLEYEGSLLPGATPPPNPVEVTSSKKEEEENIDFTTLSIQDIMYVKMILGDDNGRKQKKRRKIIIA